MITLFYVLLSIIILSFKQKFSLKKVSKCFLRFFQISLFAYFTQSFLSFHLLERSSNSKSLFSTNSGSIWYSQSSYILVLNLSFSDFKSFTSSSIVSYVNSMLCIKSESFIFNSRSSHPEMFLRKGVLKICNKFTGEYPCQSAISIKLLTTLLKSHFGMGVFL